MKHAHFLSFPNMAAEAASVTATAPATELAAKPAASAFLSREEALAFKGMHAAHVVLHCPQDYSLFGETDVRSTVLLQLRFDGLLGFPGGLVDEGEDVELALNRELKEEMAYCGPEVTADDYRGGKQVSDSLMTHIYSRALTEAELAELTAAAPTAVDFGKEVLGLCRAPLYIMPNGRGLPCLLRQTFAGNALQQLLLVLTVDDVCDADMLARAAEAAGVSDLLP
eukprot:PLAT3429.1.p1 GENE.PLAT3429.1~~PLAT3429.1.p1  ORF type:complete len:225 (-),score=93.07 PLAT3429.1:81-755(-)